MFPLRDENPSYQFPILVILLIVANVAVFLLQVMSNSPEEFINKFAVVPAVILGKVEMPGNLGWITLFTSLFLHANIWHLIVNMYFLWLFGDNIEWILGRGRFLLFYFLCGIAGSFLHIFLYPDSTIPAIGASGAISGVMGAYVLTYPFARIWTLIPLFFLWRIIPVSALFYIGLWAILQLVSGFQFLGAGETGGVGYWAHIGGFLCGLFLGFVWRRKERIVYARPDVGWRRRFYY
ncbi:MAG: rhomboid family intramembrane serine protease [bacterium JZ-2024 1]